MRFAAARAEGAEAAVVVRAGGQDLRRVAVEVEAVGCVGAVERAHVVCAVGHAASIMSVSY